jgi:quinoprotein glucose dehydrogenase
MVVACGAPSAEEVSYSGWPTYQGDEGSNQYSSLDQINRSNVDQLEVAWTYNTGDKREDPPSTIETNPIIIDGVLYGASPMVKIFAVDAATGEEQWVFDPYRGESPRGVNRGVMYWQADDGQDGRILFTAGDYLYALNARTGELVESFGSGGKVDLREGLSRDIGEAPIYVTSPGRIYEDILILGSTTSEGPGPAAPGDIRAYNVHTGEQVWNFHTIPHPGEYGYETWPPDAWKSVGGANAWAGLSLDEERGIAYVPTGSASFDFYGGNRPGKNLFSTSIVALDAETGEYIWHYQTVRHNLWDYDIPAPPNLVTVEHEGERVDAVAQITKTGHVFLLDRETGEPLFPIEEKQVPPSDLKGEQAYPTQPIPTKPPAFARQGYTKDLLPDYSDDVYREALERFEEVRSEGIYTPPSEEGTVIFPGFNGGGEWGGASFDPESGLLYVNSQELPWILTMVQTDTHAESAGEMLYRAHCATCHGLDRAGEPPTYPSLIDIAQRREDSYIREVVTDGQGAMPPFDHLSEEEIDAMVAFVMGEEQTASEEMEVAVPTYPYRHTGWNKWKTSNGYPAVDPPWGTLNAIDLNEGDIEWQVPHGVHPELLDEGMPPTGTENFGGPVVTAGGLIFIGGTKDERFRAYDKATGELLWEYQLPAGGYATPSVYAVDGRQYVVIAAGGGGKIGTKAGDAYIAFALPDAE